MPWSIFSKIKNCATGKYVEFRGWLDSPPQFVVYIYKGEYLQIKEWVLKKPDIETGGDLFGLWIQPGEVVVQFVLGPGKYCRRTQVSFYQDTSYLDEKGNYLLATHGLCNIGQWHSHHRLKLDEPSNGDRRTVWQHMPSLNIDAYIMFIATIKDGTNGEPHVDINCFLFKQDAVNGKQVLRGEFKILQSNSPMRLHVKTYDACNEGAESTNIVVIGEEERSTLDKQHAVKAVEDINSCDNEHENESGMDQRSGNSTWYRRLHGNMCYIEMKEYNNTRKSEQPKEGPYQQTNGVNEEIGDTGQKTPPGKDHRQVTEPISDDSEKQPAHQDTIEKQGDEITGEKTRSGDDYQQKDMKTNNQDNEIQKSQQPQQDNMEKQRGESNRQKPPPDEVYRKKDTAMNSESENETGNERKRETIGENPHNMNETDKTREKDEENECNGGLTTDGNKRTRENEQVSKDRSKEIDKNGQAKGDRNDIVKFSETTEGGRRENELEVRAIKLSGEEKDKTKDAGCSRTLKDSKVARVIPGSAKNEMICNENGGKEEKDSNASWEDSDMGSRDESQDGKPKIVNTRSHVGEMPDTAEKKDKDLGEVSSGENEIKNNDVEENVERTMDEDCDDGQKMVDSSAAGAKLCESRDETKMDHHEIVNDKCKDSKEHETVSNDGDNKHETARLSGLKNDWAGCRMIGSHDTKKATSGLEQMQAEMKTTVQDTKQDQTAAACNEDDGVNAENYQNQREVKTD